jgi:hypothetical protein
MLQTGDILHCTGKRLLSKLIMFATKSKTSHTAIFIEIWGKPCVIEAQNNGVNIKTWDSWVKKYNYKVKIHRNPNLKDQKEFSHRVMSVAGVTGYDYSTLIFRKPFELITGKWRKKNNEHERMVCSEFAMWAHQIDQSYKMSPQEVFEFCVNNNWEQIDLKHDNSK